MRGTIVAVGLAAAVSCAGCAAGSGAPAPHPSKAVTVADSGSSGAGHNRAATQKEAARLLKLAALPPGAKPVKGPQPSLSGPALGRPGSSLIDRHRFWRVSMSLNAAWHYIESHRPAGLHLSGTSHGGSTNGGVTSRGIAWSEPDRPYATQLQLDVSVASAGRSTLIRADGMGDWIDPRPLRDSAAGPRMRVTVSGGCPGSDKEIVGVRNPGKGLDTALLPPGSPTSALICPYGGLNPPHAFGVLSPVLLSATQARQLAREARHIPLGHTDNTEIMCPADFGLFDVIAFHYAGRPDVDLGLRPSGCETIANGHILADGGLDLHQYVNQP
jgi:hypothetical protein